MSLCLPQFAKEELIRGIKEGTVVPENMTMMSSAERQGLLRSFMDEASAKSVNTLFEEKLVLKSQSQAAIVTGNTLDAKQQAKKLNKPTAK